MQTPTDRTAALARAAAGEILGPMDIAAIFDIGRSRFHALNRAGAFECFKLRPAIGPRCFSGAKVHRYIQGERLEEPVFGRKRRAS